MYGSCIYKTASDREVLESAAREPTDRGELRLETAPAGDVELSMLRGPGKLKSAFGGIPTHEKAGF